MLRSDVDPSVAAREYFTVDLRGLRAALAARAARDGMTESDVMRSALATSLGTSRAVLFDPVRRSIADSPSASQVKLSVRVAAPTARRLDQDARAAGLSRGAYLTRLIVGAPAVASLADRAAACKALNNSSEELAIMSRDINHLTQLLRQGSVQAAQSYAARHETLDRDVRSHLALAAAVLADLSTMRLPATTATRSWSRP
jgi:hypothetical protein